MVSFAVSLAGALWSSILLTLAMNDSLFSPLSGTSIAIAFYLLRRNKSIHCAAECSGFREVDRARNSALNRDIGPPCGRLHVPA
jgi:hypothetical protein